MTVQDVNEALEKVLDGPLRTAKRAVANMKQVGATMPLVVVSGGTARSPDVKSSIRGLCDAEGVPVVFTNDFGFPIVHELVFFSILNYCFVVSALT